MDCQAFLFVVCGVGRLVGSHGTVVWPEGEVRLERHHVLTTDGFELVSGEQYGVRSRLRLVLLMHGLVENSIVCVEKSLAALLVAARTALSSGPWGPEIGPSRTAPEMTCTCSIPQERTSSSIWSSPWVPLCLWWVLSRFPVLCEKVADLVLLAPALLRNFEGRP